MSIGDERRKQRRKARKSKRQRGGVPDYSIDWSWDEVYAKAPAMPLESRIDLVLVTLFHEDRHATRFDLTKKLLPALADGEYGQALDLLLQRGILRPEDVTRAWSDLEAMAPADIKAMGAQLGVDL